MSKHNSTVQQLLATVSPNSNRTFVIMQIEAGLVSKPNAVPFRCPCSTFITPLAVQTPVVSSQGKRSNVRLVDIRLCCKRCRMVRANTE
ncbi:hypothetical protein TNCV_3085881 [Trichonephila clavipes]|nr:hypothetical protein TNCV_3085881 [Trichonephila clavipes]